MYVVNHKLQKGMTMHEDNSYSPDNDADNDHSQPFGDVVELFPHKIGEAMAREQDAIQQRREQQQDERDRRAAIEEKASRWPLEQHHYDQLDVLIGDALRCHHRWNEYTEAGALMAACGDVEKIFAMLVDEGKTELTVDEAFSCAVERLLPEIIEAKEDQARRSAEARQEAEEAARQEAENIRWKQAEDEAREAAEDALQKRLSAYPSIPEIRDLLPGLVFTTRNICDSQAETAAEDAVRDYLLAADDSRYHDVIDDFDEVFDRIAPPWVNLITRAASVALDKSITTLTPDDVSALFEDIGEVSPPFMAETLGIIITHGITLELAMEVSRGDITLEEAKAHMNENPLWDSLPESQRPIDPSAPDRRPQVVEGLFKAASYNVISADYGAGKTTLAATIAVCKAQNMAFMGRRLEQSRVVFFATEREDLPTSAVQLALEQLAPDVPYNSSGIRVYGGQRDVSNRAGEDDMLAIIQRHGVRPLVIIDPLNSASVGNTQSQEYAKQYLAALTRIANKTGCTFLVMHHNTKTTGQTAGNAEWLNKADTIGLLSRVEGGARLSITKGIKGTAGTAFEFDYLEVDAPEAEAVETKSSFTSPLEDDEVEEAYVAPPDGYYARKRRTGNKAPAAGGSSKVGDKKSGAGRPDVRTQAVIDIVDDANGEPVPRKTLLTAIMEDGTKAEAASKLLQRLVNAERLERADCGGYILP